MSVVPSSSVACMVNLTRIYTRTGDQGRTRLVGNESIPKTDARLAVIAAVDEANCAIGVALALRPNMEVADCLLTIQNELFDVGADLATPTSAKSDTQPMGIGQQSVVRLETWCDQFGASLPSLASFVLPGGAPLPAQLHLARSVVRRAELAAWAAAETTSLNPQVLVYLNRLSDLLFVLARHCAHQAGAQETLWAPASAEHRPG